MWTTSITPKRRRVLFLVLTVIYKICPWSGKEKGNKEGGKMDGISPKILLPSPICPRWYIPVVIQNGTVGLQMGGRWTKRWSWQANAEERSNPQSSCQNWSFSDEACCEVASNGGVSNICERHRPVSLSLPDSTDSLKCFANGADVSGGLFGTKELNKGNRTRANSDGTEHLNLFWPSPLDGIKVFPELCLALGLRHFPISPVLVELLASTVLSIKDDVSEVSTWSENKVLGVGSLRGKLKLLLQCLEVVSEDFPFLGECCTKVKEVLETQRENWCTGGAPSSKKSSCNDCSSEPWIWRAK